MLPLGTAILRPFSGYAYPIQKRRDYVRRNASSTIYTVSVTDSVTTSQIINSFRVHTETVTQSITTSDAIANQQIYNRSLTQTVTTSQTIGSFRVHTETVTQSISVSQILFKTGHQYFISVSHDITTGQILKQNRALKLSVIHTVTTDSIVAFLATVVSDHITVTQTIALLRVLHLSVTDNIAVSQTPFINSPRFLSVSDIVQAHDFYFPRIATNRQSVTDSVTTSQTILGRNATHHLTVSQNISIGQYVRVIGAVTSITVTQSITVSHRVNTAYKQTVQHDVALTHTISKRRYVYQTIITANTPTSSFKRDLEFTITTALTLTSVIDRQIIVERDLENVESNISVFKPSLYLVQAPKSPTGITTTTTPHPVVSGIDIIYGYLTLLESAISTIVLPVPELNDSLKHNDSVDLKRTMDGGFKGYVKKGRTVQLNYTWMLDYDKAREFREWVKVNMSEDVRLTNWKGEIWYGQIINDDFQIKAETKYAGNARQKTSATLLFEGVKING